MNATTANQIASFLNTSTASIKRCEEWAKVYFVVIEGRKARFVSKKVIKTMTKKKIERWIMNADLVYVSGSQRRNTPYVFACKVQEREGYKNSWYEIKGEPSFDSAEAKSSARKAAQEFVQEVA